MKVDPFPLFGPEMTADPYSYYDRLRELAPVYWSDKQDAWIVTGYDAVATGLLDPKLSSDRAGLFRRLAGDPALDPFFDFVSKRMVYTDPPTHERLRGAVSEAFTPHAVEAMRPRVEETVDRLLAPAIPTGRIDLINDFALPLPVAVVCDMLGIPVGDRDRVHSWSERIVAFFSTHPARVPHERYADAQTAMHEVIAYMRELLPRLRRDGMPCLLNRMAEAGDGGRMSEEELFANANIFLVAGEYITNLIGNGVLALLQHPEELNRLRQEPSLIPNAVEELLRCVGPLQFTHRVAREDVALGGELIKQGQLVFLFLAAANRDPAHFPEPDRVDVARSVHKHVSFGLGHHFCLGSPLARLQLQTAFSAILNRLPGLRLAAERVDYRDNFNVRGLRSLPVEFDPG